MKTQVCIVGGGPSGLLLGQLLGLAGIHMLILKRRSRAHVLSRIRAGVLEAGTVDVLKAAGVADRLEREGPIRPGTAIAWDGRLLCLDFQ